MKSFKAYPSSSRGTFAFGVVMSLLGVALVLARIVTYGDNKSWENLLWLIIVSLLTASYIYGTVKIILDQRRSTAFKNHGK